jgi:hypothetical protein
MDATLPVAPMLFNYDMDRDGFPGLVIAKGGSGPDEGDDARHQHWFTGPFAAAATIQGDAMVKLWSAMKDFNPDKVGSVTVYLRDCEGWDCVELGSATISRANWQSGSSWTLETFIVPIDVYTIAPGHSLELVVVVDASSEDDMWFAYDTNNQKSRVSMFASSEVPLTAASSHALAYWVSVDWPRLLFA